MKKLFVIPLLCLAATVRAQLYHVTDLGTLPGDDNSVARGINIYGEVVGESVTSEGIYHAFVFSNGVMQPIGSLGGPNSGAFGINSAGMIVGLSDMPDGQTQHAFLFSNGAVQDIGTLGGSSSSAGGINEFGQIIGTSYTTGDTTYHGVLYSNGAIQDLGTPPGSSWSNGAAISSTGLGVGSSAAPVTGDNHACLYDASGAHDLGTLGGDVSYANGINSSGQAVGYSDTGNLTMHAFLYTGGSLIDLGTLGGAHSAAWGINDAGTIVGNSYASSNAMHAFIYKDGLMRDLNFLLDSQVAGVDVEFAFAINGNGLIAAWGPTQIGGQPHGMLLTPIQPNTTVPNSFTLFRGLLAGGSLYNLQFSDVWYLSVRPGPTANQSEAPAQIQLSGISPTANPFRFSFTLAGHVNTVGLSESILLYNFTTGTYETLSTNTASRTTDSTVTVTPGGSLSRFVNASTHEVRARVAFFQSGPTSLFPWTASIGLTNWTIQ